MCMHVHVVQVMKRKGERKRGGKGEREKGGGGGEKTRGGRGAYHL